MTLDFSKLGNGNTVDTVLSPREIFRALPSKQPQYLYLRDVQAEVLDQWFARREEKDLVLKMNTGSGKTLVGLLILKSCLNEQKGPALYLAPDSYLVKQVMHEAESIGLQISEDPSDFAFRKGQAICIINIYKLINGRSIFGVGDEGLKIDIGSVVIDDAHACLANTESQFTLNIDFNNKAYKNLLRLFTNDLRLQSETGVLEVVAGDPQKNMLVPYWAWISNQSEVSRILFEIKDDENVKFVWPLLKDNLNLCRCVFGGGQVEISPRFLPINSIPSFVKATRRVFMTATLPDDNLLIADFDVNPESMINRITPQNANDIGDRMILIPQELNPKTTNDEVKIFLADIAKKYNIVVIVPSKMRAKNWADVAQKICTTQDLGQAIDELKSKHVGIVVLINKYDGIDLPYDSCRILVIDGLPDVRKKIEKIEQSVLEDSEILINRAIQRIEQGMGRAIRSIDDQCVVFLLGARLVNILYAKDALSKFSATTRAQLELSNKVAEQVRNKPLREIKETICYSLEHDPQWLKASRNALLNLKYDTHGKVDNTILKQREAFSFAQTGQFDKSIISVQQAVDSLKAHTENVDKSFRGWLMQDLAEYTHYLDPVKSQEILKSALGDNPRLLKPLKGISYQKMTTQGLSQVKACSRYLKEHYDKTRNLLLIRLNSILDELQFRPDSYNRFEKAMKELAFHIGFIGQQPEVETGKGPDNLWGIEENKYLVIACKNEAETSSICKRYCDELGGFVQWFKQNYPEPNIVIPIMIHPSNLVEKNAFPLPDMRIINKEKLEYLRNTVTLFGRAIAASNTYDDTGLIKTQLLNYKLVGDSFINEFTIKYIIKK